MIVKKNMAWHRLPRPVHRLESVAVSRANDEPFYHSLAIIPHAEFLMLDPSINGIPTKCTLNYDNKLGLWPTPIDYFEMAITASEIFQL